MLNPLAALVGSREIFVNAGKGLQKTLRYGRPFLIFCLVFGASGCSGRSTNEFLGNWDSHAYTVKSGETLHAIAWRYNLDYLDVAKWNNLKSPYKIHAGQRLTLSPYGQNAAAAYPSRRPDGAKSPSSTQGQSRTSAYAHAPYQHSPLPKERPLEAPYFKWPVEGKVISTFADNDPKRKGIKIAGQPGWKVRAASDGTIVYSGNALLNYGNLIIIKHNRDYLSAYAHNRKLLVKEGDKVRTGEIIAELGSTGTDKNVLHFEIRQKGKPVNPLQYLPRN